MGDALNGQADRAMPSLAEVLNTLFKRHTKDGGKAYSNEDLAKFARAHGVEISQAHVWNLRNPKRDSDSDPRLSNIKVIAEFFGYRPAYFIDAQVYWDVERQLGYADGDEVATVPRQGTAAAGVMFRKVADMSPQSKALIEGLINQVSELEKGNVRGERRL